MLEDTALLSPGQEVQLPMEILLTGLTGKSIRVDIRADIGAFLGTVQFEPFELLQPLAISSQQFEIVRAQLKGINESEKTYSLLALGVLAGDSLEYQLMQLVQKLLFVHVVQGAGVGELLFAGALKRSGYGEDRVLMTVLTTSSEIQLKCNCDDPVTSSSLVYAFTKALGNLKRNNI